MTLGSIIARLDDETFVEQALAGLDDLVLIARLRSAAEAAQEPLGSFASLMVGRFVQHAPDDKWLALMTAASRADDPAAGALRCILWDALQDEEQSENEAPVVESERTAKSWSGQRDSNPRPPAPKEKGRRQFSLASMRVGASWFRFVRVEFTPTCPPPALRI